MDNMEIVVFGEDDMHVSFIRSITERIAEEEGVIVDIQEQSGKGGVGRLTTELGLFRESLLKEREFLPDAIVVLADADKGTTEERKTQIRETLSDKYLSLSVIGIPDPHVEAWILADMDLVQEIFRVTPRYMGNRFEEDYYKKEFRRIIGESEKSSPLGPKEWVPDIVGKMNLSNAYGRFSSLRHFVTELRNQLRRFKQKGAS